MAHKNTKYSLNERYFEHIDSEEKAYWLGFLAADGCIYQKKGLNQISIKLKGSDVQHIEKFACAIETNKPVLISKRPAYGNIYTAAHITICCKQMAEDLNAVGLVPQKSLTALPWIGSDSLMRHYWRGVVDGDGWVSQINSSNRGEIHSVGLCGSLSMVASFENWIRVLLDLHVSPQPKGKIHCITYGGTFAPQKVAKLLYESATVYLDRKYKSAMCLISKEFEVSKFSPRKDITNEQLIKAYKETASIKKIGVEFGIDPRTVSRRLKDAGVELKGRWNNG